MKHPGRKESAAPTLGEPPPERAVESLDLAGVPSRRLLHLALLLMLVAVPLIVWLARFGSPEEPGVGGEAVDEPAPDFTLELFDGTSFTLSRYLEEDGRPVVMNFWASWCVPCREEMPALEAVASRRPEVTFLGVAVQDTETAARAFAEEVGVSYPLGLDGDGTVIGLYPVFGIPTTWFITGEGRIAFRWAGILDQARLESLIEEYLTG